MSAARRKPKKKTHLLLSVWLAAFALILVFFLFKFNDIRTVLKETQFFTKVFGKEPAFIADYDGNVAVKSDAVKSDAAENGSAGKTPKNGAVPTDKILQLDVTAAASIDAAASANIADAALARIENITSTVDIKPLVDPNRARNEDELSALIAEQSAAAERLMPQPAPLQGQIQNPSSTQKSVQAPNPRNNVTEERIWFVEILADGIISRRSVIRSVPKTSSSLASAVNSLLAGPTSADAQKKLRTLVPEGVRLLSQSVYDSGVAVLDFSDEFAYNRYGVEGYLAQLMQIVYTATEIGGIDSVQFLINGELTEYLGGEGVWIGSPLSRSSFR
ncbi:MAG: GerMN domain-containing protein [Treponemataceae bacterium]|nr:MAG: GerMN domain-containing protein [Treponemataceae bacterium]